MKSLVLTVMLATIPLSGALAKYNHVDRLYSGDRQMSAHLGAAPAPSLGFDSRNVRRDPEPAAPTESANGS